MTKSLLSVVFLLAALGASAARAEYRCTSPQTWIDRGACAAAAKGAEELRRFVWNMERIRINLGVADYLTEAQMRASAEQRTLVEQRDQEAKEVVARRD